MHPDHKTSHLLFVVGSWHKITQRVKRDFRRKTIIFFLILCHYKDTCTVATSSLAFRLHLAQWAAMAVNSSIRSWFAQSHWLLWVCLSEAAWSRIENIYRYWGGFSLNKNSKIMKFTQLIGGLFGEIIVCHKPWIGPKIHPSVFNCSARIRLRGLQIHLWAPDFSFPGYFSQLWQRDPQSACWLAPSWMCQDHLPMEVPWRILTTCPNHLNWLLFDENG